MIFFKNSNLPINKGVGWVWWGGEITILRLNVFDQHVKNLKREMKISERLLLIRKTTTDYLLGYSDLKKRHFKLTTRDLSEQKELRADPKAIQ